MILQFKYAFYGCKNISRIINVSTVVLPLPTLLYSDTGVNSDNEEIVILGEVYGALPVPSKEGIYNEYQF